MIRLYRFVLSFLCFILIGDFACVFGAEPKTEIALQFRADFYERNLKNKTEKGRGNAWIKSGEREIWADYIELDRTTNKATANGNVRLKENNIEIFCNRAIYTLDGSEAILEEATLLAGSLVVTGGKITKLGPRRYEIQEGIYTNCNTIPITDRTAGHCLFDWKIYGHKFDLTLDGYVLAYDVLIYSKDLPLGYLPFFMAPAKSKRQSGLLFAAFSSSNHLGAGFGLPFFWALSPWQDLTLTPTFYSKAGMHAATEYRYFYSSNINGSFNLFLNEKPFNARRHNPEILSSSGATDFVQKNRWLGFLGEAAFTLQHLIKFENGVVSRQSVNYVSDPFYVQDYSFDLGASKSNLGFLRSLVTVTYPSHSYLFYGGLIHHQSLIVATDSPLTTQTETGADRGAVSQFPIIGMGQKLTDLIFPFFPYFSFEWDTRFTHFWRPEESFDNNIPLPSQTEISPGAPYQNGDFIREGQRFQFEPRAITTLPLSKGLEIQPLLKGMVSVYRFDLPEASTVHRESITTEIPLSFYLSKSFKTSVNGFENIAHLIQPRLIYGSSLYGSAMPTHPFFQGTHPPFDSTDLVTQFEYFRFELIQRLRTILGLESVRFLTFQLSNQYNSRLDKGDPRFFNPVLKNHLGPIESYLNITIKSLSLTLEGYYQWHRTASASGQLRNEGAWTSTLAYDFAPGDKLSVSTLMRTDPDPIQDEQLVSLGINKALPIFVNFSSLINYSLKHGELRSYEWGAHFASKPSSCWSLSVLSGRTQGKQDYARFIFQLNFGGSLGKS